MTNCQRLVTLIEEVRKRIQSRGFKAGSALRVHDALKQRPMAVMEDIARRAIFSSPAASSGMRLFVNLGITRKLTGRKCKRVLVYTPS